jgi:Cdc6-like AAA superfamily ATPase
MTDMTHARASSDERSLARVGIDGLDEILRGGLPRNRLFLIDGVPGTGKTTLALQFLPEEIFEPFVQVDTRLTRVHEGVGWASPSAAISRAVWEESCR